ncbi:hypothetical protein C1645_853435 [Glomus cerebriforme]|uniref:Putative restriction endonuclease domain-containing protein n=1 Tax=Glomus cerebriforme TaxID=658196 RepID=A0A397STH0_9GLOM|nr:hypothetical protein C1645_853435 [Glomus cerebriforme]
MNASETSSNPSVQTLKTKFRLTSKVLDSAREKLLELLEKEDTEELVTDRKVTQEEIDEEEEVTVDDLENGIIVTRNISLDAFLKYRETGPTVKMSLLEGKVIVHEVQLGSHAVVAGEIVGQMKIWHNYLMVFSGRNVIVGRNDSFIPDGSIQPQGLPQPPAGQECDKSGWPYPTVVVEVGLSEGVKSLHSKARKYLSQRTTIQVYIAVKIFSRRRDGTRALIAFVYERASNNPGKPVRPVLVKSFGSHTYQNIEVF